MIIVILLLVCLQSCVLRRYEFKSGALYITNPTSDQLALLLVEGNYGEIFVDATNYKILLIQILSNSRSLMEKLLLFDNTLSRTTFEPFILPNESRDSCVKAIHVKNPRNAHIFSILTKFQPAFRSIRWDGPNTIIKLKGLAPDLSDLLVLMMTTPDYEYIMTDLLDLRLKSLGLI